MKKAILFVSLLGLLLMPREIKAAEPELHKAWATAYCITGTTATGTQTVEGRTVASKREWFGKTMVLWEDDGSGEIKPENFLGIYTVEDTGGDTIKSGAVIDVYISEYTRAKQFGSKRVIFVLIDAEG